MACRECHLSKIRCEKVFPCHRCVRLSKSCVPHESNQGKGRKRRQKNNNAPVNICTNCETLTPEDRIANAVKEESLKTDHIGLLWLIRSWVSFAVRRRSFRLLSKAGDLAIKCNLTMDDVLCGSDGSLPSMDFLAPILVTPARDQICTADPLRWSEVPDPLLTAMRCNFSPTSGNDASGLNAGITNIELDADEDLSHIERRWIFIHEMNCGFSKFLVTPAFEYSIASWSCLQNTWKANEKEVTEVFLPPAEKAKLFQCLIHQLAIHRVLGVPPRPSRFDKVNIHLANGSMLDVDLIFCLFVVNPDIGYIFMEFIPRENGLTTAEQNMIASGTPRVMTTLPDISSNCKKSPMSEVKLDPVWYEMSSTELAEMKKILDLFKGE